MTPDVRSGLAQAYNPYLNRAGLRAADAIIAQMADDLRVIAANRGCVEEGDLELLGWSLEQIQAHGKSAARKARARGDR